MYTWKAGCYYCSNVIHVDNIRKWERAWLVARVNSRAMARCVNYKFCADQSIWTGILTHSPVHSSHCLVPLTVPQIEFQVDICSHFETTVPHSMEYPLCSTSCIYNFGRCWGHWRRLVFLFSIVKLECSATHFATVVYGLDSYRMVRNPVAPSANTTIPTKHKVLLQRFDIDIQYDQPCIQKCLR